MSAFRHARAAPAFGAHVEVNDELADIRLPEARRDELKRIVANFRASHDPEELMYLACAFQAAAFGKRNEAEGGSAANATPGPWNIYQLAPNSDMQERLIIAANGGEDEVCGVVYAEADAKLIASAPDLRLALSNLLEGCYEADARHEMTGQADGSLLDAARNALVKAGAYTGPDNPTPGKES